MAVNRGQTSLFNNKGILPPHLRYLVGTTHNSMQVTTSHYKRHKWHNTRRKDLPWFLETRTHHPKKCSRYPCMWGVK